MRSTRLSMQLPLATLTRVVGWLALLFGVVTILPITVHLFIDQGGAFGLGWLLIPLIIPLCAGLGYAILAVGSGRFDPAQVRKWLTGVHIVVALAIVISYFAFPVFPFLLYTLPLFIGALIRYRKHVLKVLLLLNLLTLTGGVYLFMTDWSNGRKVALIEVFKVHRVPMDKP